jgi:hypothetical protein
MGDEVTIDQTIEQVARGLAQAGVVGIPGDDLAIKSIELTLKLTTSKAIGAKAEGKFLGILTVGGEAKWERENVTELVVTLALPEEPTAEIAADNQEIDGDIRAGIESIRQAVRTARSHLPLVPFSESTLSLSFTVDAKGSISILGTGEVHSNRAHTVKLTLVPNS